MFVQDVVPWRKSRHILYWRLRRLLLENQIKSQMLTIQPNLSVGQAEAMLTRWFVEDKGTTVVSFFDTYRFLIFLLHVTTLFWASSPNKIIFPITMKNSQIN